MRWLKSLAEPLNQKSFHLNSVLASRHLTRDLVCHGKRKPPETKFVAFYEKIWLLNINLISTLTFCGFQMSSNAVGSTRMS